MINRKLTSTLILLFVLASLVRINAEGYSAWQYSAQVQINTSSIGLPEDVANFPLLIRLNSSNFDFSEAQSDGDDIRFSQSDGTTPLDYEKELWDNSSQVAEIWVKIPTVLANNSDQSFIMYWGNASAGTASMGPDVFERSNNFRAVYHMTDVNDLDDASATPSTGEYDGTNCGTQNVTGVIGKAVDFSGADWIDISGGVFSYISSQITIELWQYGDPNYQPQADRILWGRDYYGNRAINIVLPWSDEYIVWDVGNSDGYFNRIETIATDASHYEGQWNHWVFTKNTDDGSMRMYLNGTEYYGESSGNTFTIQVNSVRIGADQYGSQNYDGYLDEFRFSKVARSTSWIKLSYETQRENQAVVTVIVTEAPVITTHPQSQTVNEGDNVTFSVEASGDPTPTYKWQKLNGTWADINGATESTYSIPSVDNSHTGSYRAIASNEAGSATSTTATLTVNALAAPAITTQPEPLTIMIGQDATFTVAATGNPTPTYQWHKNGAEITGETSTTLNLLSVPLLDSGSTYFAKASNSLGTAISDTVMLKVTEVYTCPANACGPVNVEVNGHLRISGIASFNNNIKVDGEADFNGDIKVSGAIKWPDAVYSDDSPNPEADIPILAHGTAATGLTGLGDGVRLVYDANFLEGNHPTDDVLRIEKTDGNQLIPDGGIAFVNLGTENGLYKSETAMFIKGDGNIGIGTTNPSTKLHVKKTGSDQPTMIVEQTDGHPNLALTDGGKGMRFEFNRNDDELRIQKCDEKGNFVSLAATITSDGTVRAERFKIGEWVMEAPDYVFEKDYFLRPLKEVEEFLNNYKHLPEVPSAEEMKKEGIDLAKMNMTLLKKIEELHLYVIEQNKKIEKLSKEVDALKR